MTEDKWWASSPYATAAAAKASAPAVSKPSPQDLAELRAASAQAQAERNARREYASTRRAVQDMGTGPLKARVLDVITPDEDGGILDTIGGFIGTPFRALFPDKVKTARAQLNTVSAKAALAGSAQMKGSSSDKDTALMRTAGVNAIKPVAENLRILDSAERDSGVSEAQALFKSKWISRYGSMGRAAPSGMTYEQGLALTERNYLDAFQRSRQRKLPTPPPRARRRSGPMEIDLNGHPIR